MYERLRRLAAVLFFTIIAAACTPDQREAQPVATTAAATPTATPVAMGPAIRWKALLIGGDKQEMAFDNAPRALRHLLLSAGLRETDIILLSAHEADSARDARFPNLVRSAELLDVGSGEGCLVFITSHGLEQGLVINTAPRPYGLTPALLDGLLKTHCKRRPTMVVTSGCHSGVFAERVMAAPNRVIYTAARRDRTSFGCNAALEFTFFDYCLLSSLPQSKDWSDLAAQLRACVMVREVQRRQSPPSEPLFVLGEDMQSVPLPKVPPAALAGIWHMVPSDLASAKAVPFGGVPGTRALDSYRAAPGGKAFAVHPGGNGWIWRDMQPSDDAAASAALDACAMRAGSPCLLFARGDQLLWHDSTQRMARQAP